MHFCFEQTAENMPLKFRGLRWVCVYVSDLHMFHTDPLVIGQNGPHRHCLNTLLLLREWKRREKSNHIKTSFFSQHVHHALEKKKSTMSHIRLKQTMRAKPSWHFLHICTQSGGGCLHSGLLEAFKMWPISPRRSAYMRLWETQQ